MECGRKGCWCGMYSTNGLEGMAILGIEKALDILTKLQSLRHEYLRIQRRLDIPNMTSEDTIGIIHERDDAGKRIVDAVVGCGMKAKNEKME